MTEKEKDIVRDVLNLIGGPIMDYSPEVAVDEYASRIKKASTMLIMLLK